MIAKRLKSLTKKRMRNKRNRHEELEPSKFEIWKEDFLWKFQRAKMIIGYFLMRWTILPIFSLLYNKTGTWFKSHLDNELNAAGCCNDDKKKELFGFLALFECFNRNGFLDRFDLHKLSKITNGEILSPLTFNDDDWVNNCSDGTMQNKRLGSVFKYPKHIIDIDSICWYNKGVYDIASEDKSVVECYDGGWSGSSYVYDEEAKKWMIVGSGNPINLNKKYFGNYHIKVPRIEVIDSSDEKNDYKFHITLKSSIPSEFYEHYELVDSREIHNWDDETKSSVEADLKYIEENHFEQLLYSPVKKINVIESVDYEPFADVAAMINIKENAWLSKIDSIIHDLVRLGINEHNIEVAYFDCRNDIIYVYSSDEEREKYINIIEKYENEYRGS